MSELSREQALNEIALQLEVWIRFAEYCCKKDNINFDDEKKIIAIPTEWPSVGMLRHWIKSLRAIPAGTTITEDKSTWPEDGQEIVFREKHWRSNEYVLKAMQWPSTFLGVRDYLGCIWWSIEDLFQPPTEDVPEQDND